MRTTTQNIDIADFLFAQGHTACLFYFMPHARQKTLNASHCRLPDTPHQPSFPIKAVTVLSSSVDTTASGIGTQNWLGVVVVRQIPVSHHNCDKKSDLFRPEELTQVTADLVAELLDGSYAETQWRANSQLEGDFIL